MRTARIAAAQVAVTRITIRRWGSVVGAIQRSIYSWKRRPSQFSSFVAERITVADGATSSPAFEPLTVRYASQRSPYRPKVARRRSAGLRSRLQRVPMLIERLRQSGYQIQPEPRQPVRRPGFFQGIWQRIKEALRFLGG